MMGWVARLRSLASLHTKNDSAGGQKSGVLSPQFDSKLFTVERPKRAIAREGATSQAAPESARGDLQHERSNQYPADRELLPSESGGRAPSYHAGETPESRPRHSHDVRPLRQLETVGDAGPR